MHSRVIAQIQFEMEQIDPLFIAYEALFQRAQQPTAPNLVEITALASVLHSFYTGLENIFTSIAKGIDGDVPGGPQSHCDLLLRIGQENVHRSAVLTVETIATLSNYLGFRHFYRHTYSFFLDWTDLKELGDPLPTVWTQIKTELRFFTHSVQR